MFHFKSVAALFVLLFTLVEAQAAERTLWTGRDVADRSIFWSCSNTSGDNWEVKKNSKFYGKYVTTASNADYIEIKSGDIIFRIYSDKLKINEKGSKFKFIDWAAGKWAK